MLELKIGNTFVEYRDIQIPVVLRSPLFSEGKGSYLFNFSLPASDALKDEFGYFHRPANYGSSSIKKPLVLKYGPLVYSGTATITEADERTYEVSCPVDNGELAQLFKSMKLSDIDLGGVRDVDEGRHLVKAMTSEDMIVHESLPDPYDPIFFPIEFDNIIINPDGILNSVGDTLLINETGSIVFSFKIDLLLENLTYVEVGIYRSSIPLFIGDLKNGLNYVNAEIDVEIYDTLELKISARRKYDNPNPLQVFNKAKFTIYTGAELNVFEQGILNNNNGLDIYPDGDYACFPFENSKFFDKLEDDTYQIDHISIKETYSKFFPVINYYKENLFPLILLGESEEEAFLAFNLFNPFPYLAYVIKQMAKELGILIDNNLFEEPDQKQLVIFNLFAENSFITSELIQPKAGFNLQDHVPDVQLSDYWINLCKLLGIAFDYKANTKTLRLKYLKDIATSSVFTDFPGVIITKPALKAEPFNGYRLTQETGGDEYISNFFKSIDGLNYKGTVTLVNSLGSITDQEINDCYYVTSKREYWYWNYDKDLAILNWIFYSKDFLFVVESTDEEIGEKTYEVKSNINAIMMNDADATDINICAPSGREWLIPVTRQPGNFDGLPDYFSSTFSKSLLFYHGLRQDSQLNLYPLASNNIYDFAGNPIVFESVEGGDPGYTHDLSLRWDGPNGLYEKRYKHWINLMLKSRGVWRLTAHLSPLQLSKIDWFTWYNGPGYKFLIKEIRFNINHDKISVADIDILIR